MKKLLVLLALLLALTMVFVACQNTEQPDDTTVADQPTEEPTQDVEDPTAEPTDPEETTEEPTEAPTAEPDDPTEAPTTAKPEDPTEPPATQEPETADPMEPVNVFGAEDIQTVTGGDPSNMTQDCLTLEDGFIHVVPIGPDPYWYPFAGVDGARYVAIRYRTDATGADIQMYIGSTGGGPSDDSTMLRQPVIADSEWHVAIFDTQSLIEAGKYDGKYVSYFRFDALEAGYILDENGQPYKPDGVNYARYTLPEGCSIDVAYIGFFHNEEAIAKYDFEQYPPFEPETPVEPAQKMPAEFILSLDQANLGKTLYFSGAMSGYYFATSENIADAVTVYSEAVEGGYRMYFMDGETKTYLDIVYRDINKANVVLTTSPVGVYVWNEEANTWTVTIPEAESTFYLGTYNSYNTISASGVYYITGDNASNVGVSQFVAQWADVPVIPDEPETTEPETTEPQEPETPDEPAFDGSADFNTIVTPNENGSSSYTGPYTTTNGWVINNSAIQAGGSADVNPQFTVIGPDNSFKAPCLNGKVSAPGSIESPVLSGGISKLVINYTKMFTDTQLGATITITDLATGAVYTNTLSKEAEKDDKYTVWTFEWVLETPITGDFTIEIVNTSPSAATGNKDRLTILNLSWVGAAAETPDEPAANEIKVTTTDTYGWFDEYTFVADAAGNYTFTLPAGLGMWSAEAYSTWAEPELDYNMITEGGDVTVALAAGEEFKFLVGAYTKDEWTITYTFAEGEVGGDEPETPVESEIPALILGENTIVVSDALYNEGGFFTSITVTEEGTYTFASSNLLIRVMTDMGMSTGSAYLTPGTYEVQVVTAYLSGPCTTSVTVEFTAPEEPDEPTEPEIPDYPAIETLPFTYDVTADGLDMDGVYFIYTADNEITLVISKPAGSFVSPTATNDWSEDENGNYVLPVNAGETIVLNFWAMETIYEGSFTVTASATAPAAPEGSSENPIVLSDINTVLSFDGAHDVYYTYTASVAPIKVELHYAEGCTIEVTGSFEGDMDPGAMQYNIVIMEAGQSIVIHLSGEGAANYSFVSSGKK